MEWFGSFVDMLPTAISAISALLAIFSYFITDYTEENRRKKKIWGITAIILVLITVIMFCFVKEDPLQGGEETIPKNSNHGSTNISENSVTMVPTEKPNAFSDVRVGDTILFGSYEQDNYTGNGTEPIEWIVLDKEGDSILVISKYALDQQQFHSRKTSVTWENSDIRQWLNSTFYNNAFSSTEQRMIATVTVAADKNPKYNNSPGNDTQDKIYLLSTEEASEYFRSDSDRICYPTPYTRSNPDVWIRDTGSVWWWLRTPGEFNSDATTVNTDGKIDYKDGTVNSVTGTVRPVMWINIE